MPMNVGREIAHLQKMTVKQLRARYFEVFGEETYAQNKAWLVKRIAWRTQALQEQVQTRMLELNQDGRLPVRS